MQSASPAKRAIVLAYGVFCYALFLGVFLYTVGFIGNVGVPTSLDAAPRVSFQLALLVNAGLLTLFAVQHSGMARPAFKRWLTKFVPSAAERSTYVLLSNLAFIAVFCFWQPMGGMLWNIDGSVPRAAMYGMFGVGWLIVLYATMLINHFDLFGLRQVWLYFRNQPYTSLRFTEPSLYRWVRHPLYVGWITVVWATPTMTASHFLFAALVTGYILIAISFEERDLINAHGESYVEYRRRTPMLIPRLRRKGQASATTTTAMAQPSSQTSESTAAFERTGQLSAADSIR